VTPEKLEEWLASCAAKKADYPPGPWSGEPDRVEWKTRAGLTGLVVRGPVGALCGYVAVPPGHPDHGKDSDVVDGHAHGGLTFSGSCRGPICHTPAQGEPDDVWWLGFDCAHLGDLTPSLLRYMDTRCDDVYRDIAFVRDQVERLAMQLAARAVGDAL
jgi:hypothetical protein